MRRSGVLVIFVCLFLRKAQSCSVDNDINIIHCPSNLGATLTGGGGDAPANADATLEQFSDRLVVATLSTCTCAGETCEPPDNTAGLAIGWSFFCMIPFAVLIYAAAHVSEKCHQYRFEQKAKRLAYEGRRKAERDAGRANPIVVKTLGGDSYTLQDWGHCKDLKQALHKLAPNLGDPSTFVLLDNSGTWVVDPDDADADAVDAGDASATTSTAVNTKYGSAHRRRMMKLLGIRAPLQESGGNTNTHQPIEFTLAYKVVGLEAGGSDVTKARGATAAHAPATADVSVSMV